MLPALLLILASFSPKGNPNPGPGQPCLSGDSLTIHVFLADECVISQFFTIELERLYNMYRAQHVGFVGHFPNAASTAEKIDGFGKKFGLSFPLVPDHDKRITRANGITITPEVAIYDHRQEKLIYRGRIDDSYVRVGKRKLHPQSHDVKEIIDLWLMHDAPQTLVTAQAIGCFISFNPR